MRSPAPRIRILICSLFALSVVVAACGQADDRTSNGTTDGDAGDGDASDEPDDVDNGASADCIGGLIMDGVLYQSDWHNRDRLTADQLGEVIGTVDGQWDCMVDSPESMGDGIFALGERTGTEIRAISTRSPDDALATVTPYGVAVFRTSEAMSLTATLASDIDEIGVNSDFDGRTRFATIDDRSAITELVEAAKSATSSGDRGVFGEGRRYFIEFVHPDGLSTAVPYQIDRSRLLDRAVGDVWADAVTAALADSDGPPAIDSVAVTNGAVDVAVHPAGSCRVDRPDLTVTPGDTLTLKLDDSTDGDVRWWLNPPDGGGELLPIPSQIGPTLIVPNFDGALIVELYLPDPRADEGDTLRELCFTLASTGAEERPAAPDAGPLGMLDCSGVEGEPAVEEHGAGGPAFPTVAEAVDDWMDRVADGDRPDVASLAPVTSPYVAAADLIDGDGRSQAVLELRNDGDGWLVHEALLCPAP